MRVIIAEDAREVAQWGAEQCLHQIRVKPDSVLGLATGSTPIKMYEQLIRYHAEGELSFKKVQTFNLDEYIGIPEDHPQSYRHFMQEHLFDHIDIPRENTHIPSGMADPLEESEYYEARIAIAGGIDLQILGVGRNGHIGFNEPTSSLGSRTRVKTLAPATIRDNSRFFHAEEEQPHLAITMGIGTIMEARKIILMAAGEGKADAVKALIEGPITAMQPASVLQLHQKTLVIVDRAAAGKLEMIEYYDWVQQETLRLQGAFW